jgi:hypothetical protein
MAMLMLMRGGEGESWCGGAQGVFLRGEDTLSSSPVSGLSEGANV